MFTCLICMLYPVLPAGAQMYPYGTPVSGDGSMPIEEPTLTAAPEETWTPETEIVEPVNTAPPTPVTTEPTVEPTAPPTASPTSSPVVTATPEPICFRYDQHSYIVPTNGCTAVPDADLNVISQYSFHNACNAHDICYGTCGRSQGECDLAFYNAMIRECQASYDSAPYWTPLVWMQYQQCASHAYTYYMGVSTVGHSYWVGSQEDNCTWTEVTCGTTSAPAVSYECWPGATHEQCIDALCQSMPADNC